jgi:Rad3-related DNA helicase
MMKGFISNFMDGYNVTVSASGQTGSGKTYSMIAPVGSIQKKGGHDMSGAVLDHYGIFPRTVIDLYN